MRVSFDSNAWEGVFTAGDTSWGSIRAALQALRIEGSICAAGFRIEAIPRKNRPDYFAQPHMDVPFEIVPSVQRGHFTLLGSMGPDNRKHPGLPAVQAEKLSRALAAGIKLMYGENWMGLPVPVEIADSSLYIPENPKEASERERRQVMASSAIDGRGVGNAAFVAADGWTDRPRTPTEEKRLSRACAEWADGELVAAHIAYRHDILCTGDRAGRAGRSIFDMTSRVWLAATYGVVCMTLNELAATVSL